MTKRTLFIGDVHGCYDELMALCTRIGLQNEDQLYFVGDLINKWPKSRDVVEFVRNRPNTWSVIGNHEHFYMRDYEDAVSVRDQTPDDLRKIAELDTHINTKYINLKSELEDYKDWLLALPVFIEKESFIVVHWGIHPDYGLSTPPEIATLIRLANGKPWYESYSWEKLVIYWHWAQQWLRIGYNTIGLDTGCCFGGHLTAYCLETKEIWQVRANRVYTEPAHWKNT